MLSELEYRANFFVQIFESLLGLTVALGGLAVVFNYTDRLGGWLPAHLLALVGIHIHVGGLINMIIFPSMQRFMEDVRKGTLDFTIIKPAEAQLLASVQRVEVWKLADVILGLAVLVAAMARLETAIGWVENILIIFQSMYQAGRWPVGIYPGWLRFTLTFLIPVAFAVTVPAEGITGRLTGQTMSLAIAVAGVLLIGSRIFWKIGIKYYSGASA